MPEAHQIQGRQDGAADRWIGRVVADRYHVAAKLGSGGFGRVYRAIDLRGDVSVALKLIAAPFSDAEEAAFAARFAQEHAAIAGLDHPHVVRLLDHGRAEPGTFFVAMEHLEGPTLDEVIRAGGAMEAERVVRISIQLAKAIGAAHDHGLVHRDLKPANVVLVQRPGEPDFVKLLDFGLAGRSDIGSSGGDGTFGGSPTYVAPGQARGEGPDPRDDVYSLGVIVYELTCGRPPFSGDSPISVVLRHLDEAPKRPRMIDREIPAPLEAAILRALAKEREERFQTMREWIEALDDIRERTTQVPIAPRRSKVRWRGRASARLARTLLMLVSVVLTGLAAARACTPLEP
ncbi:serine/threonine-protein kinase [Vulgatibacter incomptus]|nr:serine/threonine-protein kinase [Vulgatibacter incomptus]